MSPNRRNHLGNQRRPTCRDLVRPLRPGSCRIIAPPRDIPDLVDYLAGLISAAGRRAALRLASMPGDREWRSRGCRRPLQTGGGYLNAHSAGATQVDQSGWPDALT